MLKQSIDVKRSVKRNIPKNKLRKASDHLYYEYWMVMELARIVSSGKVDHTPVNNALVESFATHINALFHFFYDEKEQRDDVIAVDFFSTPNQWEGIRPRCTELLERSRRHAKKEVTRLPSERNKGIPGEKEWPFISISEDIQNIVDVFINAIPKDLIGARWNHFPITHELFLTDQSGVQKEKA